MASHAGAQTTSGNGHDTLGPGSNPCDEAKFDEMLAEWGLEPAKAYIRVAREKKKASKATIDKRAYRAQRKSLGFGQYVVEVPDDDDAKYTVYAVAQLLVDDKDNAKNMRSIISSVVSNSALLKVSEGLSMSSIDPSTIAEMIEQGDLARIADIHSVYPALLGDLSRLVTSNEAFVSALDCLVRHAGDVGAGSANGLLDAAVVASGRRDIVRFIEARKRGGLRARLLSWILGGTD